MKIDRQHIPALDDHDPSNLVYFGVQFTKEQLQALIFDMPAPRWDCDPPQREMFNNDHDCAVELRNYAERLLGCFPQDTKTGVK